MKFNLRMMIMVPVAVAGLGPWAGAAFHAQWPTWAKAYGITGSSQGATAMQLTSDGGSIVAGYTIPNDAGHFDFWVLKLDDAGAIVWQKAYGGTCDDYPYAIQQTLDGGYILAGSAGFCEEVSLADLWVLKLDAVGTVVWQKTYGGIQWDGASSLQQASDGGYIVAGNTSSFGAGSNDAWVLKLDGGGAVVWQRTYGGADGDRVLSMRQTSDGGAILAGDTQSFGAGYVDAWILRLDAAGDVVWQKTYGTIYGDWANAIQQTSDGGFIVAGGNYPLGTTSADIWILKLDAAGAVVWQKSYGGSGNDRALSVEQTADGGFVVAGDVRPSGGSWNDILVLKLDAAGAIVWQRTYGGSSADSAKAIQQSSDGGYIVAGETQSFVPDEYDFFALMLDANGEIPGCSAMGTSNATVTDTSATASATAVLGTSTSATVGDTSVSGVASNAAETLVCNGQVCTLQCTAGASPVSGFAPLTVDFTNTYTATGCIGTQTYAWTFGDSGTSTDQSPQHTYSAAGTYTWLFTVTVDGTTCSQSGTIAVQPGIPGDCDGDGQVSIGEVQKAINMFLGAQAVGCGVDCNGDGQVSIGEVQKVINAFLGVSSTC